MSMDCNPQIIKLIHYLSFKMDCLREQEANPLTIDLEKARDNHDKLLVLKVEKEEQLKQVMPKKPVVSKKNKPKNPYKQDGSLSEHGKRWFALLKDMGLPETTQGPVEVIATYDEPNPNSTDQVKDWLYSLGWKPETYKYVRDKATGDERKIEQVRKDGELCSSVTTLADKEPAIVLLKGLTILTHRIGILKSFLTHSDDSGKVVASAGGFTNTLRLQHRVPIVNLPGVDKPYGQEIRECIVAPEAKILCGADVSSLEDKTKRHYMQPLDPDYVAEMEKPGFDAHLDLAKFAGVVTPEQIDQHNNKEVDLGPIRKKYKAANYSCVYGVGAPKLARETGMRVKEAKSLIEAYWKRNWAVKKVAEQSYVKTLKDGTMWLYNPLSGFYYSLRYDKDRWSTLNQSSGVYVFDAWVLFCRQEGIVVNMQYHDEILFELYPDNKHAIVERLHYAMNKVNEKMKLNVKIGIEEKFGPDYASVH